MIKVYGLFSVQNFNYALTLLEPGLGKIAPNFETLLPLQIPIPIVECDLGSLHTI